MQNYSSWVIHAIPKSIYFNHWLYDCDNQQRKREPTMPRHKSEVVGITLIQRCGNSSPRYTRENHYAYSRISLEFPTFPTTRKA